MAIFDHYLARLKNMSVSVDTATLARASHLFTPADIKTVVHTAARRAVPTAANATGPRIGTEALLSVIREHPRAIQKRTAEKWIEEAYSELGALEHERLEELSTEVRSAYPE
jgi:hypothetical protein